MQNREQHLEIEVKFHVRDPEALRQRLFEIGALCKIAQVFERNHRYEDSDNSLIRQGKLLRLRKDGGCRLTFKSKPSGGGDQDYKVYQELEVAVADFDAMDSLLNALGYRTVQTYEKWRETFSLEDTEICVDRLPFGCFVEIEGSRAGIKAAAAQLALAWESRILHNYLAIFQYLRQQIGLPFADITFENFKQHPVDIEPYLHHFRAPAARPGAHPD